MTIEEAKQQLSEARGEIAVLKLHIRFLGDENMRLRDALGEALVRENNLKCGAS